MLTVESLARHRELQRHLEAFLSALRAYKMGLRLDGSPPPTVTDRDLQWQCLRQQFDELQREFRALGSRFDSDRRGQARSPAERCGQLGRQQAERHRADAGGSGASFER